jgi:precorrin-3B synthase
MTESRRRGACPGLSAPMPTGDGLLARLLPAAPVPLDAMGGLCAAARRHGNGIIEVTARGSLQVRGLTPHSAPLFAADVAALGVGAQEGVPVIAGFDDDAADLLATQLRRALGTARLPLSAKVSIVVDGDGPLHLDGLTADVRLRIVGTDPRSQSSALRFHLGLGCHQRDQGTAPALPLPPKGGEGWGEGGMRQGQTQRCGQTLAPALDSRKPRDILRGIDSQPAPLTPTLSLHRSRVYPTSALLNDRNRQQPISIGGEREHAAASGGASATTWLGTVAPKDATSAVVGILTILAARGPAARAADVLHRENVEAFLAAAAIEPAPAPPPRMPSEMIGLHAMRNGMMALGVGLVFGHTHADMLSELVRVAARQGVGAVRPVPDRAMLLTGVSVLDAGGLITAAERLGFVVHADDPRRRIAACPGAPACASGLIPARTLASTLAPVLAPIMKPGHNGVAVHISGCLKGCAHPGPAALTLVGASQGCGVVHHGAACETPHHYADPALLCDEIARLVPGSTEAGHG